jgi:hypothetical protein
MSLKSIINNSSISQIFGKINWPFRGFWQLSGTTEIKDLSVGKAVEVKFKDPKTIGFIDNRELSYTRFNPDELVGERLIQGIVEKIELWPNIGYVLTVATFQMRNNQSRFRSFMFLENEIENIRLLK